MDEQALIDAACRGELAAFNRLVLQYQGMVYNLAYRILGNAEGAEDAAQEAFIKAYRNLSQYRGGSFKAWLLRIVTNVCYDQLRHVQRRPASSLEDLAVDPEHAGKLVDHAEQAQSVAGIEQAHIVEILDHHHIGSIETRFPVAATFDPVGSTATRKSMGLPSTSFS